MGCNCGKNVRGSSRVAGRNPSVGPKSGVSTGGSTPQQLQALLRRQAELEGNNNQTNDFERRRIEKLKRDAIRRALGH